MGVWLFSCLPERGGGLGTAYMVGLRVRKRLHTWMVRSLLLARQRRVGTADLRRHGYSLDSPVQLLVSSA